MHVHSRKPVIILVAYCALIGLWSLLSPLDFATWVFEIFFGVVGVAVLALTFRKCRFSNMVYVLVAIHFTVLALGAKYTYADMPAFNWLRDEFGLARNYFDRVGHFMQGFVPAMIARELLLRKFDIKRGKFLFFIVTSICLAISAFYEFIEWWMVIAFYPEAGMEWLGIQGDIWDAQQDMFMAFVGAILAQLLLNKLHDRSMKELHA